MIKKPSSQKRFRSSSLPSSKKVSKNNYSKSSSKKTVKNTGKIIVRRKSVSLKKTSRDVVAYVSESNPARPLHQRQPLTDLPFSYNQTKLALLVRDPFWVYSYWDFSGESWNWITDLQRSRRNLKPVIRIHNIDAGNFCDVEINLDVKNWYLDLGLPDTTFEAELGLLDPSGMFYVIVKSNRIRTPRNGPSNVIDPDWDPSNFDEIYRLSGGGQTGRGSEIFSRAARR